MTESDDPRVRGVVEIVEDSETHTDPDAVAIQKVSAKARDSMIVARRRYTVGARTPFQCDTASPRSADGRIGSRSVAVTVPLEGAGLIPLMGTSGTIYR